MIKKETSFIDLKQVKIDDPFFSRVQDVVIHTMLPYQERVLHDEVSGIRKSHVIKNFRIAADAIDVSAGTAHPCPAVLLLPRRVRRTQDLCRP